MGMGETIVVLGSDGRGHAIAESMAQHPNVDRVICVPGTGGTARGNKLFNVSIDPTNPDNFDKIYELVRRMGASQVFVSAELPLDRGVVDFFYDHDFLDIVGCTQKGAQIETSKMYSFDVNAKARVPQAKSEFYYSLDDLVVGIEALNEGAPCVVKSDVLTGGKGVSVYNNRAHALANVREDMGPYKPERFLLAERLYGPEFSVFGIPQVGRRGIVTVIPIPLILQDNKRLLDGDQGPNTGGMGASCVASPENVELARYVAKFMMTPAVREMQKRGDIFNGILYAGCMMTADGPKIIEYNCRFGDPETQPLTMMLQNGLYVPISRALDGKLCEADFIIKPGASCCVVLASNGYPGKITTGFPIGGLDEDYGPDVKIFHAGTKLDGNQFLTSGGRVVSVNVHSPEGYSRAQQKAYAVVDHILAATRDLNGGQEVLTCRRDIAPRAIPRNYGR